MQTQLQQRLGADTSIYDVDERVHLRKSVFDYSRKVNTTIDIGTYVPIDWFFAFPQDRITVNIRYLLDTLPLVNVPYTNYRVRVHFNVLKLSSIWKGWNSFISQGRRGEVSVKEIPFLSKDDFKNHRLPSSLASYLGLPVCEFSKKLGFKYYLPNFPANDTDNDIVSLPNRSFPVDGVSALPFMAYQKVWRFDIMPHNLMQDNEVWLPEDLSEEWRLDYLASNMSKGFFSPQGTFKFDSDGDPVVAPIASNVPTVGDNCVDIRQLRYAVFDTDYFTSAKPWLVRGGSEQGAALDVSDIVGSVDFDEVFDTVSPSEPVNGAALTYISPYDGGSGLQIATINGPVSSNGTANILYRSNQGERYLNAFNKAKISANASAKANLTANNLRSMLAYSVWQERNALTNGNYNEFIKAHFGDNPKQPDYEPYYLGGTSDIVNFGQVLQTSAGSDDSSPLGTQAGLGSSNGQGHIFTQQFDDYSLVMGCIFITPEVYYEQGVGHEFTDKVPDDWFMPEFAKTGFEPILNQELMAQGTEDDTKLFGYQTRNAYLKSRKNLASGMFALPISADRLFGSYVQAREFSQLPKLSMQFVSTSPENIRRDFLAYTNYPAFKLQFATDVKLIRALPYMSTPETFGF